MWHDLALDPQPYQTLSKYFYTWDLWQAQAALPKNNRIWGNIYKRKTARLVNLAHNMPPHQDLHFY